MVGFLARLRSSFGPTVVASSTAEPRGPSRLKEETSTSHSAVQCDTDSSSDSDDDGPCILSRPYIPAASTRRGGDHGRRSMTRVMRRSDGGEHNMSLHHSRDEAASKAELHPRGACAAEKANEVLAEAFSGESQSQIRNLSVSMVGSNCTVMEGFQRSSVAMHPVVVKVFTKAGLSTSRRDAILREAQILRDAAEVPHVMRVVRTAEDDERLCTIVRAAPGVTMIELMAAKGGRLSPDVAAYQIAVPLLRAIAGLHKLGIVHRHLKPEHVMCHLDGVTLIDFTDAAYLEHRCLNNRVGDLPYIAPEVLTKPRAEDVFHEVLLNGMAEEELPQYNEKADMWSFGVMMFEALTGQQPFIAESTQEMIATQHTMLAQKCADGVYAKFIGCQNLDQDAKDFLSELLLLAPGERPSAAELLKHPFLKKRRDSGVPTLQSSCPDLRTRHTTSGAEIIFPIL